jgi:hypothetical protein
MGIWARCYLGLISLPLLNCYMHVANSVVLFGQVCQLMIMCNKKNFYSFSVFVQQKICNVSMKAFIFPDIELIIT